jgi:hypothetical protein
MNFTSPDIAIGEGTRLVIYLPLIKKRTILGKWMFKTSTLKRNIGFNPVLAAPNKIDRIRIRLPKRDGCGSGEYLMLSKSLDLENRSKSHCFKCL